MRNKLLSAGAALALALTLAACSGGSSSSSSAGASSSAAASASATAPSAGDDEAVAYTAPKSKAHETVPAQGEAPEIIYGDSGMPNVGKTSKGTVKLGFPEGNAPAGLRVTVLEQGKGEALSAGSIVSANYVGQVWGSNVPFDSSFARKEPSTFPLSQVVKGWSYPLARAHVGDKLIISIPPDYGYGASGNAAAGIKGTDTIAFYVEVVNTVTPSQAGQKDAKVETDLAKLPITYSAGLGAPVTDLKVKDNAEAPKAGGDPVVKVIARGTGKPLPEQGTYVLQYAGVDWKNTYRENSWTGETVQKGPVTVPTANASVFNQLKGLPVGSRVFVEIPANGKDADKALAVIVDIVGTM